MMLVYLCPSDRKYLCSWEGHSGDILEHFTQEHEELLFYSNSIKVDLKNPSENYLLFFEDEIFLVQHKVQEETLNIVLRYLGPAKIASKVTYDLTIHASTILLSKEFISASDNGFRVDLTQLNKEGIEYVDLTLHVNGSFSMPTSRRASCDSVFDDDLCSRLPHMPLRKQKSYDENKRRSCENINFFFEEEKEPNLSRSKTIGFEEIKRRNIVKRAYSSVSLECIQEDELELNCTDCGDALVSPPIFLCPNRHRFCARCTRTLCKICQQIVTDEKDVEFEEKLIKRHHPCQNRRNGCTRTFLYKELLEHEINCKFCDYRCPISECSFTGPFKNVHKHLRLIHSSVKIFESFIVIFQKNSEAFLVNEDKGIFYCYFKLENDYVRWYAKFCGPKERRFFCELKFKDGKVKKPILLTKIEDTYSVQMSFQDLKREKLKSKNAVLTITC